MPMISVLMSLLVALLVALLSGCGGSQPTTRPDSMPRGQPGAAPPTYVVRSGDTLFGIARRFGLDHRDLARWNGLGDGSLIHAGQTLRLRPKGATGGSFPPPLPREPPPPWQWPTRGKVVSGFGASPRTASGVLIAGEPGQPVHAAAAGEVVYSGSGLAGYGQLLIIRHGKLWLSAYGHNRELRVSEGARVSAGQQIATMGEASGSEGGLLHFEIRIDGEPVDPLRQLPAR
jgi:lipoprotein NlpD